MFAPCKKVVPSNMKGDEPMVYVNVTLVTHIELGKPTLAQFDDNNEWPTTWLYFGESNDRSRAVHVFGAPEQILVSWFGPPQKPGEEPPQPQPGQPPQGASERKRIVVPGVAVPPGFDPRGGK